MGKGALKSGKTQEHEDITALTLELLERIKKIRTNASHSQHDHRKPRPLTEEREP